MPALQAQFQADVAVAGILPEHVEHRVGHGIGPRADGEADDLRVVQRRVVQLTQAFDGGVRVGRRLEVGEEAFGAVATAEDLDAAAHLGADVGARQAAVGTEAAVVAVDAAAGGDGAVDVGAGEAGIDGDAPDAATEAFLEETAERIVAPLRRELLREQRGGHGTAPSACRGPYSGRHPAGKMCFRSAFTVL